MASWSVPAIATDVLLLVASLACATLGDGRQLSGTSTSGRYLWVPRDHVLMDLTLPDIEQRPFAGSSNGLASGNTRDEAIVHALCELIERDQKALWTAERMLLGRRLQRIDPNKIRDPRIVELFARTDALGLTLALWSISRDIDVPCFVAALASPSVRRGLYGHGASGAGCHPVPTIAMIRAITEAFQSRLTFIAGGRDDLFWSSYTADLPQDAPNSAAFLRELAGSAPVCGVDEVAPADLPGTATEMVSWLLSRLQASKCGPVVCCDLSRPGTGLSVVKLVAPGSKSSSVATATLLAIGS